MDDKDRGYENRLTDATKQLNGIFGKRDWRKNDLLISSPGMDPETGMLYEIHKVWLSDPLDDDGIDCIGGFDEAVRKLEESLQRVGMPGVPEEKIPEEKAQVEGKGRPEREPFKKTGFLKK